MKATPTTPAWRGAPRYRGLGAAILGVALITSCASGPRFADGIEPERALPSGALAYARLDRTVLAELLAAYGGSDAAKAAKPMTDRTDSVVAAIMPGSPDRAGGLPVLVAVASGRYPSGAAAFKLGSDADWQREGQAWKQKNGELRVSFAGNSTVLLGTRTLDELTAAVIDPGPSPIPDRWRTAWSADVALYLPDPLSALAGSLPITPDSIPLRALTLSATRHDTGYATVLSFEFEDERAALVYAPLCRLFLYAAANSFWPDRARVILGAASWSSGGTLVSVSGLDLDAAELAAFAASAGR